MGGYTPLRPWSNGGAPAISAAFLTALEAVLCRPASDTETGKYFLTSSSYVNAASMGAYVGSISRSATPSSVTIDEVDLAHTGCGAAATDHLGSNGFHVFSTTV